MDPSTSEPGKHSQRLASLAADEKKRKKELFGQEEVYRDMMRNINSGNKKFLDAIRFKTTQELREFKKTHNKLA